jgi:hypothetical protein
LRGWLSFYEGTDIEGEFRRIDQIRLAQGRSIAAEIAAAMMFALLGSKQKEAKCNRRAAGAPRTFSDPTVWRGILFWMDTTEANLVISTAKPSNHHHTELCHLSSLN